MTQQSKKRNRKTTTEQMTLLVDYLENNRVMISGKMHPMNSQELENKWDEVVNILNNVPHGSRKDKKQWKNFLYECKSKTKKKARINKESLQKTGGGTYESDDLSDLENRLLSILGWVSVMGCADLPEEIDPENGDQVVESHISTDEISGTKTVTPELAVHDSEEEIELGLLNNNNIELVYDHRTDTFTQEEAAAKTGAKRKTKPKIKEKCSSVQSSTEMYCKSTTEMAVAVKEMAQAISYLAEALKTIAIALEERRIDDDN